ncbi:MAG: hypothetical protein H6Q89_2377 [Myxococcaceae bacterium]|nr:hypothetical protein [Myxococcaceae bacterium]
MSPKPPDPSVAELKQGARAWLYPRVVIGVVLVVVMAVYIFWPR